jgi:hypothetical protein
MSANVLIEPGCFFSKIIDEKMAKKAIRARIRLKGTVGSRAGSAPASLEPVSSDLLI